jgi:hypothetical protein
VGFGGQYGYYTDYETGPGNSVAGSSLLLLTHRYYDPATGRFVNRDPIGYDGGINLYGFASGNPINAIDPSGLDALFICGRNHNNPGYMEGHAKAYAENYEATHPGKKAHIVSVTSVQGFIDAVNSANFMIDHFEYVGHGSQTQPKLLLGDDDMKAWFRVENLNQLDMTKFAKNADFVLTACHGAEASFGSNSIAAAFAKHFNRNVDAYDGDLNFGFPWPPHQAKTATPLFILNAHYQRGKRVTITPQGSVKSMSSEIAGNFRYWHPVP